MNQSVITTNKTKDPKFYNEKLQVVSDSQSV